MLLQHSTCICKVYKRSVVTKNNAGMVKLLDLSYVLNLNLTRKKNSAYTVRKLKLTALILLNGKSVRKKLSCLIDYLVKICHYLILFNDKDNEQDKNNAEDGY